MSAHKLKLVTFEIYKTLVKVTGSPSLQYARIGREMGLKVTEEQIGAVYDASAREFRREYPVYGVKQGITFTEFWEMFIHRVFTNAGFGSERSLVAEIAPRLISAFESAEIWTLSPKSHETLKWIKDQGLMLGVVSKMDKQVPLILENLGVGGYFDFYVTPRTVGTDKPNAPIFKAVLNAANLEDPAQAVHVGDDVINDYLGARAVGMRALLLRRPGDPQSIHATEAEQGDQLSRVERDHVISDLEELRNALARELSHREL